MPTTRAGEAPMAVNQTRVPTASFVPEAIWAAFSSTPTPRSPARRSWSLSHRDNIGQSDRFHAQDAPSTIEYVLPGLADLLGIRERAGRKREVRGHYVVHVETGIKGREREQRVPKHSGRDQEPHGDGDL